MERLFEILRPVIQFVIRRPLPILFVGLALAVVGGFYAAQLRIDTDLARLIPESYPSVQALEKLRAEYGGESEAAVVIESPSFEANKRFAEALIPRALALQGAGYDEPYFTRVTYRRDVTFLENNALYFATGAELDSLRHYLEEQIEDARLKANPFYFELEEEEVEGDASAEALLAAYEDLVGKEYPISEDSTALALRFYPSGAQTDIGFIESAYRDLVRLVETMEPASYHPEMEVTLAGRLLRQLIEVTTIVDDVKGSLGSGILVLLFMVVAYFFYKSYRLRAGKRFSRRVTFSELARTPVTALVLGLPLLASEAWTFGLVYFAYSSLNVMTSTLGLVLFGLGIDFGIHFYARYLEEREEGSSVAAAVEKTFMTTGRAIAAVAVTTAAAFFILMLADFQGFSQFGFIAGLGILLALLAMTVLLPALLVSFERYRLLNLSAVRPAEAFSTNGRADGAGASGSDAANGRGRWRFPRARLVIVLGLVALGLSAFAAPYVSFEYHFGALEPEYEEYEALRQKVRRVYSDSQTRNAAYVLVDRPEEVPAVVNALRAHMAADTLTPTIRAVESLQDRFPVAPEGQTQKLRRLSEIRSLLDDPFLRASDAEALMRLRRAASTQEPIALEEVPEFLKQSFTSKSGEVGRLVIIYPREGLSDGRKSMQFADDVGTITTAEGRVYHAASTSIVASDMLRLMMREAPWMVGLTIALIIALKIVILRRLRWVVLALLPLLASFLWMFGLMALFGLKLNFYNLVVLPTVLGIGDDSGIHIVHRYLEEGRGSIRRVLRSTGEHITMSALTTMVGFGGLLLSMYPGLRSIGELAVLGVGLTLVAALVFLPALLQWFEDRVQPIRTEGAALPKKSAA